MGFGVSNCVVYLAVSVKYSLPEIERRWLAVEAELPNLKVLDHCTIVDKYITQSRLRLREVIRSDDVRYKLTKKYGKSTSISEPVVNIYLDKVEFNLLNQLEGNIVRRHRYYIEKSGTTLSINVTKGLPTIIEAEFISESEAYEFVPPRFCGEEVSANSSFEVASLIQSCNKKGSD